ncbi:MAG: hypothetical protein PHC75_05025 [Burkholderiales bacterium]|nr:hypothetical protein [Burkholderiales bacterium]
MIGTTTESAVFSFPLTQVWGESTPYDYQPENAYVRTWSGLTLLWGTSLITCEGWTTGSSSIKGGQGIVRRDSGEYMTSSIAIGGVLIQCNDSTGYHETQVPFIGPIRVYYTNRLVCVSQ